MRAGAIVLLATMAATVQAADVDVSTLKTFGTMGKQVKVLGGGREAELFAHEGYRFHEDDPVFFQNGLRLTCRCGETLDGETLHDPPETEYTTYVWLYQW